MEIKVLNSTVKMWGAGTRVFENDKVKLLNLRSGIHGTENMRIRTAESFAGRLKS